MSRHEVTINGSFTEIHGEEMHYLSCRPANPTAGVTLIFLHGNPTSSEIWRQTLSDLGNEFLCIAPDLIGMGRSAKPDISYDFVNHARYLDGFIDALASGPIVFVAHDWGVALAADRIARAPRGILGFAFTEGRLEPMADWSEFDEGGRALFQSFRTELGERLILDENLLVEKLIPGGTMRSVGTDELDLYRSYYPDGPSRRPLLQWTRNIPVAGDPPDTAERMQAGWQALTRSPIPKLAMSVQPGAVIGAQHYRRWQHELPNLRVVDLGAGSHFVPLDRPHEISAALRDFVATLPGA